MLTFTALMMILCTYLCITVTLLLVIAKGIRIAEQRRPKP